MLYDGAIVTDARPALPRTMALPSYTPPRRRTTPPLYATLKKRYTTQALRFMGFVRDGSAMVKRGAHRTVYAEATSADGEFWSVRPLVRDWR
ncbi:hypothetical protein [Cupriavidus sp. TMH.W2]|uniref:hypothetical protein n=1 Tax=Cupriavidus sp. TMH.W2 TaxID=3434465 RepID=UPI003D76C220